MVVVYSATTTIRRRQSEICVLAGRGRSDPRPPGPQVCLENLKVKAEAGDDGWLAGPESERGQEFEKQISPG